MPARKTISSRMMIVRVRLAFFWVGSRKAMTPFETASTPVIAVQPLAKTLASTQSESIDALMGRCGGSTMAAGWPCAAMARKAPTAITTAACRRRGRWG
jgi:hypothetical protein